ncbi:MAG: discoidin domain-containing protein, partial [Bacteroidota bacterium]
MNIRYILISILLSYSPLLGGQNFTPDASIWLDTWASCQPSSHPIQEVGTSHWVQYDFGTVRNLSKTWIWNTNDPTKLNQGFKSVRVDYSEDGENWTNHGEMQFPKGTGEAIYSGFPGPDLVGIKARYVILTALNNHGDPSCFGLAEVKFNLLSDLESTNPIEGTEECLAFEFVDVEEVFRHEAFIYWEYPESSTYLFAYRVAGSEEWIEIELEETEIVLDDLIEGTTYEFIITVECEEEKFSDTGIRTFTTLTCEIVEEVSLSLVEEDAVMVDWEPVEDVERYLVAYQTVEEAEEEAEPNYFFTEETFASLEGLEKNTEYYLVIGTPCGGDADFAFSEEIFFMTNPNVTSVTEAYSSLNEGKSDIMQVFPNPSSGQFRMTYQTQERDLLNYAVYDVTGKMVF